MFGFFNRLKKQSNDEETSIESLDSIALPEPLDLERRRFLNRCIGAVRGVGLHAIGTPNFSIRIARKMRLSDSELPVVRYWNEYAVTHNLAIFNRVADDARLLCRAHRDA
jgi:hypothetical protein